MSSVANKNFTYDSETYNLDSPLIIIPEIIKLINPQNVVDIGCGIGNFLKVCEQCGVKDILGVDGSWVKKEQLQTNISLKNFKVADLEKPLVLDKKYDLAISLEVGEHLSEAAAPVFVESLVKAGHVILFSAAIPGQGGQDHINEQYLDYWIDLFSKHDYVIHDILRPLFWDSKVQAHYKQNIVFFLPKDFNIVHESKTCNIQNIIHPQMYGYKVRDFKRAHDQLTRIREGRIPLMMAFHILIKSIIGITLWQKIRSLISNTLNEN